MTVPRAAVAGLGVTEVGKVYDRTAAQFAADAVRLAVADAGLSVGDIDGLLVSSGVTRGVRMDLQVDLGLRDLRFLSEMQAFGTTAIAMIQTAAMAVISGTASAVACVWADDPLQPQATTGSVYGRSGGNFPGPWTTVYASSGMFVGSARYAMAARRHMERFGTTHEQLGAIAVAQRRWAELNPQAQMRSPLSLDQYLASRWVAEPFRLLDCCLVSNGGAAVIVTSAERAADLQQPVVAVAGWGSAHPGRAMRRDEDFGIRSGAAQSGPRALEMAGLKIEDIDVFELYDCYTFTALLTMEDYGICPKGEGGPFAASGALGPDGTVKVNTGGGQLSGFYLWGMTPVVEGVTQARGQAGARQVRSHDRVMVSGNGGILDHHATLVLEAER
ncbi:acetyl-CoA acetyltransferase [Nocardioides sp. J9]|uniref:thiolase family protein n=1 Tax=Nocardioides sp. J9 TaxID=935844 RepID=UPI0011A5E378|nr:thiolase family protein [Nocardioides sp. J9]TWG98559.1 acetyl-CoA acetyltransferase [Nocardioides sp. J9]